jgi:hypothetical protein
MNSLNPISAVGIDRIIGAHFNREPSLHAERGQAGAQDNESTILTESSDAPSTLQLAVAGGQILLGLVLHSLPSAKVFRFESDTLRKLHRRWCVATTMTGACISGNSYSVVSSPPYVLARLSPNRTAGQFPIWDRIGRVDGCVSVTFRIVDVDRAGIVWGSVEWKKTGLHILRN